METSEQKYTSIYIIGLMEGSIPAEFWLMPRQSVSSTSVKGSLPLGHRSNIIYNNISILMIK